MKQQAGKEARLVLVSLIWLLCKLLTDGAQMQPVGLNGLQETLNSNKSQKQPTKLGPDSRGSVGLSGLC